MIGEPMTTNQPTENGPEAEPTLEPPAPSTDLTLQPPQPVAAVAPASASAMVPLDQAAVPGLEKMAQDYVGSIVDARRPLARVREEGREHPHDGRRRHPRRGRPSATECSRRQCVRSSRGFDAGSNVSKTLLDLRKTIEGLDPAKASGVRKLLGDHPVRRPAARLLPPLRERADPHQRDPECPVPRPGRAPQGQRCSRAGEGASLGDDATAGTVRLRRSSTSTHR